MQTAAGIGTDGGTGEDTGSFKTCGAAETDSKTCRKNVVPDFLEGNGSFVQMQCENQRTQTFCISDTAEEALNEIRQRNTHKRREKEKCSPTDTFKGIAGMSEDPLTEFFKT